METAEIAMTFPACLDLQRGISLIEDTNPIKASILRTWLDGILAKEKFFDGMTPDICEVLVSILGCPKLKNLWIPSPKAKEPKFGSSVTIAAMAIVYRLPIATLNRKAFEQIDCIFPLPGVFNPSEGGWMPLASERRDQTEVARPALSHRPLSLKSR